MLIRLHSRFGRIFTQRCFYLFVSLLVLLVAAPFAGSTFQGRIILNGAQSLVLIAAVAAVGRAGAPFLIALLLGIPAFCLLLFAQFRPEEATNYLAWAYGLFIAFYLVAVSYLMKYVFNPEVMSEDKLFGAAAGYLMLGILWAYAYNLLQFFDPQAFGVRPGAAPRGFHDLLFMSFGCLTSNGPGEIVPTSANSRTLVMLEQVVGTLFVAILIARLAGLYPRKG
jgi:Ion channel